MAKGIRAYPVNKSMNSMRFPQLRDLLARLYPEAHTIRRVVDDAELDASRLPFQGTAQDLWHAILREAEHQQKTGALLAVVNRDYGANQEFQAFYRSYRQQTSDPQASPQPRKRQPAARSWLLAPSAVLLILVASVAWYQGCTLSGGMTVNAPIPTEEATLAAKINEPTTSPTASKPVAQTATSPTITVPVTGTTPVTVASISPPTTTVAPETLVGLRVLDGGVQDHTYLIEGNDIGQFSIGDDLVVYGEPIPGTEVAIALLKVIGKSPNSLTAQTILIDPRYEIRIRMRVDNNLGHLSESQLIPIFDYVDGYFLRPTRIRLRPDHGLAVGAQLQALAYERIGGAIVDALPMEPLVQMKIMNLGLDGQIAGVELLAGEWPVTGTVVSLVEAFTSPISPTLTDVVSAKVIPTSKLSYPCGAVIISRSNVQNVPVFETASSSSKESIPINVKVQILRNSIDGDKFQIQYEGRVFWLDKDNLFPSSVCPNYINLSEEP